MPRFRFAVMAATLVALGVSAPAAAKMPPFSIEIDPPQPVAGESATVTVRTWADAEHTQPAGITFTDPMRGLIGFVPPRGTPLRPVYVTLHPVDTDLLRGDVILPSAGDWTLTAWLGYADVPSAGYPQPMAITVAAPFDPALIGGGLLSAAAGLLLLLLLVRARRRAHRVAPAWSALRQ